MAQVYFRNALTGGGAALDGISYSQLADGDKAFVDSGGIRYGFAYDSSSAASESSPDVIKPDDNTGNGRWLLKRATTVVDSRLEIVAEGNTGSGQAGNVRLRAYNGALVVEKSDGAGGWLEGPVFDEFI